MENKVKEINSFLKQHLWCDFSLIHWSHNLTIGGSTSFSLTPDIIIVFEDVFFVQCLGEWKTDTTTDSFFVSNTEKDVRELNLVYQVIEGYTMFIINAEDISKPMYICARNISYEILNHNTVKREGL